MKKQIIYAIEGVNTVYIGETDHHHRRWAKHRLYLRNSYLLFGSPAKVVMPEFKVLEELSVDATKAQRLAREKYWIEVYSLTHQVINSRT